MPENGNRAFAVEGTSILICRSGAGVFALENMCSHATAALEGGRMRGPFLFCPLHGMRIDVRDGCPSGQLTTRRVKTWPATLEDGRVFVEL